jgi:flagellar hook-basal body complex protein FliE
MADLNIQNLNKIVQTGDIEKLFTGTRIGGTQEERVTREMQVEGLSTNAPPADGKSFGDILKDSVDKVNLYQAQADTAIKELVAGRNKNIHETMLTIERADTSLKLMMQVRNKILDAYKEIMRMQV